jgi:mono/diheme cytochrome c family protein
VRAHGLGALALAVLAGAGCRQDMHDQPKYRPFRESTLFADKRSARPLVPGTVARSMLRDDDALYTGKVGDDFVTEIPIPVTADLVRRGRTEFDVFCSPCHGRTGFGDGMIVQRGFKQPPSYHTDRLRQKPVGYFFDVMSRGFGAMPDYASQIPVHDRWAIAAYVRTLQLSEYAPVSDVPTDKHAELERTLEAPAADEAHP